MTLELTDRSSVEWHRTAWKRGEAVVRAERERGLARVSRVDEEPLREHLTYLFRQELAAYNCSDMATEETLLHSLVEQALTAYQNAWDIQETDRRIQLWKEAGEF